MTPSFEFFLFSFYQDERKKIFEIWHHDKLAIIEGKEDIVLKNTVSSFIIIWHRTRVGYYWVSASGSSSQSLVNFEKTNLNYNKNSVSFGNKRILKFQF